MTEATTPHVPSRPLRDLIARATDDGLALEGSVVAFADAVHRAAVRFEHEVAPLRLPDAEYQAVAAESGLDDLLALAHRMETTLGEAVSAA